MIEMKSAAHLADMEAEGDDLPHAPEGALLKVLASAQRFLDCRDRARAVASLAQPPRPCSLAEAIERDFAGFDLERAESDFRAALDALCGRAAGRDAVRRIDGVDFPA